MTPLTINPTTLETALRLARLGWPVQPGHHVGSNRECSCKAGAQCPGIGKHPRTAEDGREIAPSADAETLRSYFTRWPFASVRIKAGGAVVGLDIDPRNGGDAALEELIARNGPMPDTVKVDTGGGGRHFYFACADGARLGHKTEIAPGIELCNGQALTAPPSRHASGGEYRWAEGRAPWEIPIAEAPDWVVRLGLKRAAGGAALSALGPGDDTSAIPKGRRRRTLLALGASMRARGATVATIETTLNLENERRCVPPWDGAELRRKMGGILAPLHRYSGPLTNPNPAIQTDTGRAVRLAAIFGVDVRWCGARKSWYAHDGAAWARDDVRQVEAHAKDLARLELAEVSAGAFNVEDDEDGKLKVFKRAIDSFAGPRIRAVVDLARSEPGIPITPAQFDADPHLLNTPSGTLDLRTMRLRDHDPADLITMVTGAPFEADARSEEWEGVLEYALPDPDVRDYFHRVCGSFLEGLAPDDVVPAIHGPTGTGKSTVLRAVAAAMGSYARSTDYSTFAESSKRAGRELAALVGRRAVFAFEGGQGVELDAERIKRLSSGDPGAVRDLYESEQEHHPRFKIVLVSNFRPVVKGDSALWRRLREVPFRHQVERPDLALRHRLQNHPTIRAAVLGWMIRGYVAYKERGLEQPEAVTAATDEFRHEADPFEQFLDSECVLERVAFVLKEDLERSYIGWSERTESPPLPWASVRERLKQRGCTVGRRHAGRGLQGIRLRSAAEQAEAFAEDAP